MQGKDETRDGPDTVRSNRNPTQEADAEREAAALSDRVSVRFSEEELRSTFWAT